MVVSKQSRRLYNAIAKLNNMVPGWCSAVDVASKSTMSALRIDAIEEVLLNNRLIKPGEVNVAFNARVETLAEMLEKRIEDVKKATEA